MRIVIAGWGIAGRARARAVEATPGWTLAGVVSRRSEHATTEWDRALSSPDVDAIAVCTENAQHHPMAGAALDARKHVLLEYPPALNLPDAESLYDRAHRTGRTLHLGELGRLRQRDAELRDAASGGLDLSEATATFHGGFDGWIADDSLAGSPVVRGYARLSRLLELCGPLEVEDASLARSHDGYLLHATFRHGGGGIVRWEERRQVDQPRRTVFEIVTRSGRLLDDGHPRERGLFQRDFARFCGEISSGRGPAAGRARARALSTMELIGRLEQALVR